MRFEVPQFIEVEDKIIGPFTWKQFVYLGGGAGILVIMWLTLPFIFFVIFGLPIGALAGGLAFHKVNNRPFSIFLESMFNYATKKKLYIWKKDTAQSIIEKTNTANAGTEDLQFITTHSRQPRSNTLDIYNKNT